MPLSNYGRNVSNINTLNCFLMQKSDNFKSKMDRKKFRQFLHDNFNMTDDAIMDRIFKYLNKVSSDDIDTEEWVLGFNIFLKGKAVKGFCNIIKTSFGSDETLTRFCFDINENENGYISRDDMMLLLKDYRDTG